MYLAFGTPRGEGIPFGQTYIGGKERNKHKNKRHLKRKEVVAGIISRNGKLSLIHTGESSKVNMFKLVEENICRSAVIITDQASVYEGVLNKRDWRVVNHAEGTQSE